MNTLYRWIIISLLAMLWTGISVAQSLNTCDSLVETALTLADKSCFAMGRNQVCYGNVMADVGDADGLSISDFDSPGDVVEVNSIHQITTAPLNIDEGLWGIVLMRLQANIEGTVPGQAVTFLVFGDAELEQATVNESAAHAFIFKSGIGKTECNDIPSGGLIFQSAAGRQEVQLTLNGIDISAGSTLFIQSIDENTLMIALIEGHVEIVAGDVTQQLTEGTQIHISLDEDGLVIGQPSEIESFDPSPLNDIMQLLPGDPHLIDCAVGKNVEIAPAGLIYLQISDGPHYSNAVDLLEFEATLEGTPLPAITDTFIDAGHIKQIFDVGVLEPGEYAMAFTGRVTQTITDPLNQTWGPEEWSWTCTLTVEED